MKTIVIILGLLVGQVLAQTTQPVNLDRLVNVVHYPSRDWYYGRVGTKKFPFDSVSLPKYLAGQQVLNTSKSMYIQRKFDFNKKKMFVIFNEGWHFGMDSIASVNKLNDHTIQVVIFEDTKEKQLLKKYVHNPGEFHLFEDYVIDFEKNFVTYHSYSIYKDKLYSKVMCEPTLGKLIVNRFDNK